MKDQAAQGWASDYSRALCFYSLTLAFPYVYARIHNYASHLQYSLFVCCSRRKSLFICPHKISTSPSCTYTKPGPLHGAVSSPSDHLASTPLSSLSNSPAAFGNDTTFNSSAIVAFISVLMPHSRNQREDKEKYFESAPKVTLRYRNHSNKPKKYILNITWPSNSTQNAPRCIVVTAIENSADSEPCDPPFPKQLKHTLVPIGSYRSNKTRRHAAHWMVPFSVIFTVADVTAYSNNILQQLPALKDGQ